MSKNIKPINIIALIFGLGLLLFFSTCKKFKEDGKRSWHKPEKRILAIWYLKEFSVDGIDSVYKWYDYKTNDVTDTIRWQLIDANFSFHDGREKKDKDGQTVDIYVTNVYVNNSYYGLANYLHLITKWNLINKKKQVQFDVTYSFMKGGVAFAKFPVLGNGIDLWNIQKLTDKEMILEANDTDNKHIRIKFQKK